MWLHFGADCTSVFDLYRRKSSIKVNVNETLFAMAFVHVISQTSFINTPWKKPIRQQCRKFEPSPVRIAVCVPRMLFGFGSKNKRTPNADKSDSGVNPYRALGVGEDATYEEVDEAVKRLSIKYADDRKKLMMLDVYKDKIFDDKLQKRMSGALTPKIKESPYERKPVPKKRFVMPAWAQGIFKLPDFKYTRRTGIIMGIFVALGFVTPTLAGSCMAMAFIAAAGFLYNRGLPEPVRDEYGAIGEVRPVKHKIVLKTLLINLSVAAVFFGLAQLYMIYLPLPLWCPPDAFVNASVVIGLWMSCLFFMAQDPNDLY